MPTLDAIDLIKSAIKKILRTSFLPLEPTDRSACRGLVPNIREEIPYFSDAILPDLRNDSELDSSSVKIEPWDDELVQHIGVDVRLGDEVWVSDTLTRLNPNNAASFLQAAKHHKIGNSFICQPDPRGQKIYYFLTHERIRTPPLIEYKVDSRSTTGRVGCMSHQASNGDIFDGRILIALQPYAFPIEVIPEKTSVSQVVFRYAGTSYLTQDETRKAWGKDIAFYENENLIPLESRLKADRLELRFSTKRVYRARRTDQPIDLTKVDQYNPHDFFEELEGNDQFTLEPHNFYLLGTRETISLGKLCAELSRENSNVGTGLWSHFAGFFMPGFSGEGTLECWTPVRRIIYDGDPAGLITLDKVLTSKEIEFKGPYQHQKAPRLPKMFKSAS